MDRLSQAPAPANAPLPPQGEVSRWRRVALATGLAASLIVSACSGGGGEGERSAASDDEVAAATTTVPTTEALPTTTTPETGEALPMHEGIIASVFWIGETAGADNGGITNEETEWDGDPRARFGGVDDPNSRDFEPKHNPFYAALPAMEFTEDGPVPGAHEHSPWADEAATLGEDESLFKGRWIEVRAGELTAYVQWLDTGPFVTDDYDYVFGEEEPSNTEGLGAGIDLSPDAARHLGFEGPIDQASDTVSWRFVSEAQVPDGPWRDYPAIDNVAHWE